MYISEYVEKKDYKEAKHYSGSLRNLHVTTWNLGLQTISAQELTDKINDQLRSLPVGQGDLVEGIREDLKAILLRLSVPSAITNEDGESRGERTGAGPQGGGAEAVPVEGDAPIFPGAYFSLMSANSFDPTGLFGDDTDFIAETMVFTMPPTFL